MRRIISLSAAVTIAAITLTACGSGKQGTAERASAKPAGSSKASSTPDCSADSNLSQSEWLDKCASSAGATDASETELKVGDTFKYTDGLKVTVVSIQRWTKFGEFDERPGPGKTAFRINIKLDNQSKKPIDLDNITPNAQGATKGGDTDVQTWESGAKGITGRLAPGVADVKNWDGTLDKQYGNVLLVTVTRLDTDSLGDDPHWTGPIR